MRNRKGKVNHYFGRTMITVQEAATKWRVSEQRVRQWLSAEPCRIKGAKHFGKVWAIPDKAKRPAKLKKGNGK